MEMLKTPLVDVTARLDPGLLFDAMALLEAGIWTWLNTSSSPLSRASA